MWQGHNSLRCSQAHCKTQGVRWSTLQPKPTCSVLGSIFDVSARSNGSSRYSYVFCMFYGEGRAAEEAVIKSHWFCMFCLLAKASKEAAMRLPWLCVLWHVALSRAASLQPPSLAAPHPIPTPGHTLPLCRTHLNNFPHTPPPCLCPPHPTPSPAHHPHYLSNPTSLAKPPYPSPPTPPLPHPSHTLPSRGVPSSSGRQLSATWRHNPCVVTAALPPCSATFTNTAYGSTPAIRHLLLSVVGMAWAVRTYAQHSGGQGQGGWAGR